MGFRKTFHINLELSQDIIKQYIDNPNLSKPTKDKAQDFYKMLCFVYNRNENNTQQGIATAEHIAEHLKLDLEVVTKLCNAMVEYGITERQGDSYVI